jgi:hypothetical protein
MSKTSIKERNKAIRLAWEREQQLVAEGKGDHVYLSSQFDSRLKIKTIIVREI